ncbi:MAG: MFS transporter [Firmicutes bacterium]|nr:MFS transporter [Bacillota bacterium]
MRKTTLTEKIGYSVASLGDASFYGFISVFLLFFLTTIAGISPAVAGTIAAVGAFWNAFFNPLIGYFADRVYTRFGRRRPLIFAFAIPMAVTSFLLFTNIDMPASVKPFYYGLMLMLYWTSYTGFFIPYLALGAEYTSDYDDRTVLRLFSSFFNMIGTLFSMVIPNLLVAFLEEHGATGSEAWSATGLFLGIVAAASVLITVATSKKKDPPCEKPAEAEGRESFGAVLLNLFKEYASVAALKPMRYLIAASLAGLIVFTMLMSDVNYYFIYVKELSAGETSSWLMLRTVLGIAFIPITGKLVLRFDKRETMIGFLAVGAAGLCLMRFTEFGIALEIGLYMVFLTICTAIYWQIMPGIFYDVAEYDRIKNGRTRTATIVSFQGLVEALAVGIGGQILGVVLEQAGFDGTSPVQTENALVWIENAATLIPVAFILVVCVALYKYPITKARYEEMLENEENSEYNRDVLEKTGETKEKQI